MLDLLYIPIIVVLGLGFINLFSSQLTVRDNDMLKKLFYFHLLLGVYYCLLIGGPKRSDDEPKVDHIS